MEIVRPENQPFSDIITPSCRARVVSKEHVRRGVKMWQKIEGLHKKIAAYVSRLITINREFIGEETFEVKTIIHLLTGRWPNGKQWTKEEAGELRLHFKNAAKIVYAFFIFLLPGGLFFMPFVAEWLHKPKS